MQSQWSVVSGPPCTVCGQVVLVGWVYGVDRWLDHLQEMELGLGRVTRAYWRLSWAVTTPLVLALLLLLAWADAGHVGYQGSVYPGWVQAMGYLITGGSGLSTTLHHHVQAAPCWPCLCVVSGRWGGSTLTPPSPWGPW